MENATQTTNETLLFIPELWISDMVFSTILALVSVYIATALIYHQVRLVQSNRETFSMLALEKKFAAASKCICILIALISAIRNANSIGLLIMTKTAIFFDDGLLRIDLLQTACKILPRIRIFALTIGTGLVYLFLWFRQRVFYVHPSIKILNKNLIKAISWSIMLVWIFYYILAMLCHLILAQYQFYRNGGCLIVADNYSSLISFYFGISWAIVSVLMQIALLGLFIFPIIKRTLWRSKEVNQHVVLLQRVKKAIIITAVCLITDILSALITGFTATSNVISFFGIYSINLFINQLATVACFDHWKLLLWPWKHELQKKKKDFQKSDATLF